MKQKTIKLTQQVRDALLALPDALLMETISEWLDKADEHLQYLDWTDEYRFAMGYRLQSGETGQLYTSYDDLFAAEPDEPDCWFEPPDEKTLRSLLGDLSISMFYHQVITIAGDALGEVSYDEKWGSPPSSYSDGYEFMQCLALYLCEKIARKPE